MDEGLHRTSSIVVYNGWNGRPIQTSRSHVGGNDDGIFRVQGFDRLEPSALREETMVRSAPQERKNCLQYA